MSVSARGLDTTVLMDHPHSRRLITRISLVPLVGVRTGQHTVHFDLQGQPRPFRANVGRGILRNANVALAVSGVQCTIIVDEGGCNQSSIARSVAMRSLYGTCSMTHAPTAMIV